ncbi:MAG: GIY-YIG nuclease family protein [Candidatus Dependentiae bacterium]|nr:GIY-YIG nuclease family protein [Candidatus Dependentiae bacterium]
MFYIYFLRSVKSPQKTYVGYTTDIQQRLETHNSGGSVYTKDDRPWHLVTYVAFDCEQRARDFEKYVKVVSGNAYAKKRFW